ncbi:LysE family translocator [Nocardia sp. NPDC058519]|uniref:LysE family translocator n=1 Tax=Nocardia sp. NPDC058519 TaxID=3346535 RepID=UPI00364DE17D
MTAPTLAAFAGLCLLLAITPGPDTFLVLRYSFSGARLGVAAAAGSGLGSLVWAGAVAVGLAALLTAYPTALLALKIIGGIYLIYLGISGFIHRNTIMPVDVEPDVAGAEQKSGPTTTTAFRDGVVSCLLNPKVGLFFLAVVPQFAPVGSSAVSVTMVLGAIDGVVAFVWLLLVSVVAARAVQWLRQPRVGQTLTKLSSAALAAMGVATLTVRT